MKVVVPNRDEDFTQVEVKNISMHLDYIGISIYDQKYVVTKRVSNFDSEEYENSRYYICNWEHILTGGYYLELDSTYSLETLVSKSDHKVFVFNNKEDLINWFTK